MIGRKAARIRQLESWSVFTYPDDHGALTPLPRFEVRCSLCVEDLGHYVTRDDALRVLDFHARTAHP